MSPCPTRRLPSSASRLATAALPRCRRRLVRAAASSADPTPDDPATYAAAVTAAAAADDWVRCLELATEVRVLKLPLPPAAYGAAARAVADGGGPWQKSVDLLVAGLRVPPPSPSTVPPPSPSTPPSLPCDAVTAVFWRLARETQGAAARDLAASLSAAGAWAGRPDATRGAALNAAARACGRGGDLDGGLAVLAQLKEGGLAVEDGTYSALSLACLSAGRPELAEELLEERDFL